MRIAIAGINGCLASGFIGWVDLFWLAQKTILGRTVHDPWEIVTASSDGRAVTDGRGRKLLVDAAFQDIQSCDAVLVPGFVQMGMGVRQRCGDSRRPQGGFGINTPKVRWCADRAVASSCSARLVSSTSEDAQQHGGYMMR
jgi:hypothetical protein